MKDLNELRDKAHQCAVEHGWHEEKHSNEHFLCLVISELMEAVEADRKDNHADIKYYENRISNSLICRGILPSRPKEKGYEIAYRDFIKDTVEDELADACIRLFDLSGLNDINLGEISMDELKDSYWFPYFSFTEYMYYFTSQLCNPEEIHLRTLDNVVRCTLKEILVFCVKRNIDIFWYIEQKIKYNQSRDYKHGGKQY